MVYQGLFNQKEIAFEQEDISKENGVVFVHNAHKTGEFGADFIPPKIKLGEITLKEKDINRINNSFFKSKQNHKHKTGNDQKRKLRRPMVH